MFVLVIILTAVIRLHVSRNLEIVKGDSLTFFRTFAINRFENKLFAS